MTIARTFNTEETNKLKRLVDEGVQNAMHIKDLRDAFKDTVKAVAEELDMKPKEINKAIRTAMSASLEADKEELENVEEILAMTGRA